jgi:hypothetical protein
VNAGEYYLKLLPIDLVVVHPNDCSVTNNFKLSPALSPTMDDWTLHCCDSVPQIDETCSENPKCAGAGLTGACCPTSDPTFGFLDCCESVPDECAEGTSENCIVTSTEEYIKALGATSDARFMSGWTMGTVLALVSLLVV